MNGENAAGGMGITTKIFNEIIEKGIANIKYKNPPQLPSKLNPPIIRQTKK